MKTPDDKSADKRINRNWQELLQELRVAQTGIQILTGFLLTLPFTSRFTELSTSREAVYSVVLCAAIIATFLLMSPVALHRALFHRGARPWLVEVADRLARWGLAAMATAIIGAAWLVLDFVWSWWLASGVAVALSALVLTIWVAVPFRERRNNR